MTFPVAYTSASRQAAASRQPSRKRPQRPDDLDAEINEEPGRVEAQAPARVADVVPAYELLLTLRSHVPMNAPFWISTTADLSTALLAASSRGHAQCLALVLQSCSGASPAWLADLLDSRDEDTLCPLMLSARSGHDACVRLLLQHAPLPQVAATSFNGLNALMHAAAAGQASSMRLLLAHNPAGQVSALGTGAWNYQRGWNALMLAAEHGHWACMQLLLAHAPQDQLEVDSPRDASAVSLAAVDAHVACLQLLLAGDLSPPSYQLDGALFMVLVRLALRSQQRDSPPELMRNLRRCAELLVEKGAKLIPELPIDGEDQQEAGQDLSLEMLDDVIASLVPVPASKRTRGGSASASPRRSP